MSLEYRISCDRQEMDLDIIHGYLKRSYWSPGIPREIVARGIENALCFGVFLKAEQVGFARMITDKATFAYLTDVFILEGHRGRGLSKSLMNAIKTHPDLQGLRRMVLVTRDAHALYSQFGYRSLNSPLMFMENWNPNIYESQE